MTNTLDNVFVQYANKRITFRDFLALDPEKLSRKEYELQQVMARLYRLNDCVPPLFHSFPERPDMPLTIMADTINECGSSRADASYYPDDNCIRFRKSSLGSDLLSVLTHELKHAEQNSEEYRMLDKKGNGLVRHQLDYLQEAQAYAFGDLVVTLDCLEKGCSKEEYLKKIDAEGGSFAARAYDEALKSGKLDREKFEQNAILNLLPILSHKMSHYRQRFDKRSIIKKDDVDVDHIPESFHLAQDFINKRLLKALKKIPHKAVTLPARLLQLLSDGHEIAARILLLCHLSERRQILNASFAMLSDMDQAHGRNNDLFSKLIQLGANADVSNNRMTGKTKRKGGATDKKTSEPVPDRCDVENTGPQSGNINAHVQQQILRHRMRQPR